MSLTPNTIVAHAARDFAHSARREKNVYLQGTGSRLSEFVMTASTEIQTVISIMIRMILVRGKLLSRSSLLWVLLDRFWIILNVGLKM